jgi:hypothetical protein
MFGLDIDGKVIRKWGARAIFNPFTSNPIDLLPDRQSFDGIIDGDDNGKGNNAFRDWINQRGLPAITRLINEKGLDRRSDERVSVVEFKYEIHANPKASHGYLYIVAAERPLVALGIGEGDDSHCRLYKVGDEVVRWSSHASFPRVGEDIVVSTNWGAARGTVVGYAVECGFLSALTKLVSPPKAWLDQRYADAVDRVHRRHQKACDERYSYNPLLAVREAQRLTKLDCTKAGLLPKTKGRAKVAAEAVYFAAGCDLVEPAPVTA